MRIEVAAPPGAPTKDKGDILEALARRVMENQQYSVTSQVRLTASELDLLCTHNVNKRRIYVECKAHRDPLSAEVFKTLLGEVVFRGVHEGWLISTGTLGKDAKGFQEDWESRAPEEAAKLTFYTPDRLFALLKGVRLICDPPLKEAETLLNAAERVGEPTLLLTPYGQFWSIVAMESGVPAGALIFSASTGALVKDPELLRRLGATDASNSSLDQFYSTRLSSHSPEEIKLVVPASVVVVATGDTWADYRPARPEHFVGRKDTQDRILKFMDSVRGGRTETRILAITGDSGMGKSSLIAKLRERSRNKRYKRQYFVYAVDVRAAVTPTYLLHALLSCFHEAIRSGFGSTGGKALAISNSVAPLESPAIRAYLASLKVRRQVVLLIFDQFEELYSRPDLFPLFTAMQNLVISTASAADNFALGFAWKTDSTVQQDHPAYHMWHRLSDHRLEVSLRPFTGSEASNALTLFQKELGEPLRPELRRQLLESSKGFPWLLKKLCIHVYELLKSGADQATVLDRALDVSSLFERDLQKLTAAENTCLSMIAKTAPADWYEVLEASGHEVLASLRDKRLVVKSGDRLNLYWDIFREYVLSKTTPSIPLSYLPSSTLPAVIATSGHLRHDNALTVAQVSKLSGLTEKSAANVIRDLVMFGVAARDGGLIRLEDEVEAAETLPVLKRIRHVLKRHALTLKLHTHKKGTFVTGEHLVKYLKEVIPTAQHRDKTWQVYADRMAQWLSAAGFLADVGGKWIFDDAGAPNIDLSKRRRAQGLIFHADAPPDLVISALSDLQVQGPQQLDALKKRGYRNAVYALAALGLVDATTRVYKSKVGLGVAQSAVIDAAMRHPTLSHVLGMIKKVPRITGQEIGFAVSQLHGIKWTVPSQKRVGQALKQWALWLDDVAKRGPMPPVPRRRRKGETSISKENDLFPEPI